MSIEQILHPEKLLHVVDIGANPIDGDPPYKSLLQRGLCRVTGFEPQVEALARLLQNRSALENYLPHVVGDGEQHTLHVTRASGMTSLLEPSRQRLAMFNDFSEMGQVIEKIRVDTLRLDDIPAVQDADWLKIDIQGSELMVFQHGGKVLDQAAVVHTEVSFVPLYEGQPTFADIDRELRGRGFIPHSFAEIKRWPIFPLTINNRSRVPLNQLLEADMVYVKDFAFLDRLGLEKIKSLARIAHYAYRSWDLALHLVRELVRRRELDEEAIDQYLRLAQKEISRTSVGEGR